MTTEEKDLSDYDSDEDLIGSDFGSNDRVRKLFDIQYYDMTTTTNKKITVVTLGDVVCSVAVQHSKVLLRILSTLEEYLRECKNDDKSNGFSAGSFESLFDTQEKITAKYNDCVKILNSMKTKIS